MADQDDILAGLEERLQNHEKAFESLLALTPAQEYYGTSIVDGRDPSEQWRAKKQTKEEKRAARKAKLDPANQKSALDVMKEQERKRKRELGMEDEGSTVADPSSMPTDTGKRQKQAAADDTGDARRREKAEKRKEKRERKKEKADKLKSKKTEGRTQLEEVENVRGLGSHDQDQGPDGSGQLQETEVDKIDVIGLTEPDIDLNEDEADDNASSAPSSPVIQSPAFDISANHSTTSSSSSILPPSTGMPKQASPQQSLPSTEAEPSSTKSALSLSLPPQGAAASFVRSRDLVSGTASPKTHFPNIDQGILQERLRARIEELRARRKADGPDGRPAKSRQELLDQRRKKEDERKAHKKELRRKAKEEEARKQEERLRGSGSPLSGGDIFSPRTEANNFSFSRLAFEDGSATDPPMSKLVEGPTRKGPQDPKTALLAAENKRKRLAGLDEQKRADIAEKDVWLNAKKRTHGERVRDDTSLLKKALKRKDKQKSKSEKEWKERTEAVVKGKEMKQKRREGNLAKRKDDKGGKKGKTMKKGGKKGRPGFEGRFKA